MSVGTCNKCILNKFCGPLQQPTVQASCGRHGYNELHATREKSQTSPTKLPDLSQRTPTYTGIIVISLNIMVPCFLSIVADH